MAFEYVWLKILQVLAAARRPMSVEELRSSLAGTGFRFDGRHLEEALGRLGSMGLVEALVLAGGGSIGSVTITPAGERKVRGVVRF
ncbi:MAG: hypothetical protein E6K18_05340 [Methanobacteriota archaeon]|nr:MAG: hypothetical protein E6K18_05340 [Euryarchaeota archaeon]